mgnify:CR=1 FL=1
MIEQNITYMIDPAIKYDLAYFILPFPISVPTKVCKAIDRLIANLNIRL